MRMLLSAMLLAMAWCPPVPAAAEEAASFAGAWRGPWYRGMSSGLMTLQISPNGGGNVTFTNLESFGGAPAPLAAFQARGDACEFSAMGQGGREFAGQATRAAQGRTLRGSARYEGFQYKFELKLMTEDR
jgi:hypothetical protein